MSRHSEPGLSYYNMDCDHIYNKKIRLLISEFGADGYWVLSCLISEGYRSNGYFFNCNDKDELELFAMDVCKKQVALVKEVISGCVRRSFFDEGVFNVFGVLTSAHMQEFYVKATRERRKKGSIIKIKQDYLLVHIEENEVNISLIPRTNPIPPGTNPQSKVKYSKEVVDSNIPSTSVLPDATAPAKPKTFKQWNEKEFGSEIAKYTEQHPKERLRAFFNYWKENNAAGTKMKFQIERTWETKSRLENWARNEEIFNRKSNGNKTINHQKSSTDVLTEYQRLQQENEAKYGG